MSARKPCNAAKNRDPTLLPIETSRVALAPKPGVEGSDYINASRMNGHYKQQACSKFKFLMGTHFVIVSIFLQQEFVVTQHPDLETKNEFWRMLWDHNAQTIVLLSALNEVNNNSLISYQF